MEMSAEVKPATPRKRSWWISTNHVVHCFASPAADCIVHDLWESSDETATSFYDAELARCTTEINRILLRIKETNDANRELSFIRVENRLLLAWTEPGGNGPNEPGAIGPDDDFDIIQKALMLVEEAPAKGKKRSWILGDVSHKIYCFPSPAGDCLVSSLWESSDETATSFYDADLARATQEINAIFTRAREREERSETLSLIVVESRPFLVWTHYGGVGPGDDIDTMRKALGLR